ncbi:hypothetical protein FHY05_003150 [Sphingomonas sp. BK580]|nr:hypothetical protein [Sphingomonas sp. BK580]
MPPLPRRGVAVTPTRDPAGRATAPMPALALAWADGRSSQDRIDRVTGDQSLIHPSRTVLPRTREPGAGAVGWTTLGSGVRRSTLGVQMRWIRS